MNSVTVGKLLANTNKEDLYKQGIYKIYHINNVNLFYIGSASSTAKYRGFSHRFHRHLRDLKLKKHRNNKLQNYVNKHGLEGIRFEILEICSPELCIIKEQEYLDLLKPYFNICKFAGSTLGQKTPLKRIIEVSRPILQYDLDGNFIKEHINSTFAEKETGIEHSNIRQCCDNRSNTISSGNFQWRFKNDNNYPLKIEKYYSPTSKRLLCYSSKGKFVKEYLSILSASKDLNIPTGNISNHLNENTGVCYGYIFKEYYDNYPTEIEPYIRCHKNQYKIIVKDIFTDEITIYNSAREAASKGIISRCIILDRIRKNIFSFKFKDKFFIEIQKLKQ